ncbi:polysaccharide biosynthesis protein [Roseovarius pelagicus]|uniref:Polysaccharide biosynthesis protein n=1 Tax=Roseovarius pelagicus TaxID=2980108 RepID=A0ABY6DFX9_9RHOB|nr:nucleoside-diphosphate sugar epimerase/dehydratase [Roseovarius pelagicus]UXX82700.1 polysaccharide biosynthesis protein [Roseovarius pelagicus]
MLDMNLNRLLQLNRTQKRAVQLGADLVIILVSFVLAMILRLEGVAFLADAGVWLAILATMPISLLAFTWLGFYRAVIRYIYMSENAAGTILAGAAISALSLLVISQILGLPIPRSVPVIYGILLFFLLGAMRMIMRGLFLRPVVRRRAPVLIYGAGSAGRQLLRSLEQGREYRVAAFIDDASELQGTDICGVRVYHPDDVAGLVERKQPEIILLAVPSASRTQRKGIVERLERLAVRVQTIPGMADIVTGRAKVNELREVAIEELLGRDPVPAMPALMAGNIRGKVVMVTGAGGSIGSELCRQVIRQTPSMLLLWELSELALYTLDLELRDIVKNEGLDVPIIPLIGSVQNPRRVSAALKRYGVQTIYHAAAYKHVPLVEHNVVEGLRNNVFGTKTVADAAIDAGVEAFILVSTDKAVRPTNIMGASKRLAELVCQAAAERQSDTIFTMVRFGNVLGSSGSVIPRFRKQIAEGGPVTVTHPEITRYFMTIPEAAQLVIQAGAMGEGGDVFVLDMGCPIRIVDLAERIVRLSGLTSYRLPEGQMCGGDASGDIAIAFSGLRPGEKLYEELLIGEQAGETRHSRIMTAKEAKLAPEALDTLLDQLLVACQKQDVVTLRKLITEAPTGYKPDAQIVDLLWSEVLEAGTPVLRAGE